MGFLLMAAGSAAADTLRVGPGLYYTLPSQAAKAAKDGDTVEIAATTYAGDVAVWRQNNLTIRGVGGRPHLKAEGKSAQGKALWVIRGANVKIENVEISGVAVPDRNGAAIRAEGQGLILDNVILHDNQMGILESSVAGSDIIIRNSKIYDNYVRVAGRSIGHNIYIGRARSFLLENSEVYGARKGHNVKSRAESTTILHNHIYDGDDGSASYQIDLSNGGNVVIRGNKIEQGRQPENYGLVSYGAEKRPNPSNKLTIEYNTFINHHRDCLFVQNHIDSVNARLIANEFKGKGRILKGKGEILKQ